MDVSENRGTPKSSILIGFAIINHPFWGTLIFGNTHILHLTFQRVPQIITQSLVVDVCWWLKIELQPFESTPNLNHQLTIG